jgi:hypothetical protein
MHALHCVSLVIADPSYNNWARELAKSVHPKFIFTRPINGRKYLHWKMSIDLSRPLVPAMGQHDPLDGLITYCQLQGSTRGEPAAPKQLTLNQEIEELVAICQGKSWATDDPLGIGGLLCGAYQLAQMIDRGNCKQGELFTAMLLASVEGLEGYAAGNSVMLPAEYRLAFRELGLSIGTHAAARLKSLLIESKSAWLTKPLTLMSHVESILRHQALAQNIENFWLDDRNRTARSWSEHRDINMVMLATSLVPDGFLFSESSKPIEG